MTLKEWQAERLRAWTMFAAQMADAHVEDWPDKAAEDADKMLKKWEERFPDPEPTKEEKATLKDMEDWEIRRREDKHAAWMKSYMEPGTTYEKEERYRELLDKWDRDNPKPVL